MMAYLTDFRSVWTFGSQENGQIGTGTDGSYNSASSKVLISQLQINILKKN